jgi:MGT family glycosyltransferase
MRQVRVLFTLLPATGSLHPLLPLAAELRLRGHQVVMASSASFRPDIVRHGFESTPAGIDFLFSDAGYFRILLAEAGVEFPDLTGPERFAWVVEHLFIGAAARRMLPDVLDFAARWRPDLVVRESLEFSGCVAAERLGVRHASVAAAADSALDQSAALAPALAALRAEAGLDAAGAAAMPYRHLHLCFSPPCFDGNSACFPATARFSRHADAPRPGQILPAWATRLPNRPNVLVSLGTVFHRIPGIYEAIIEALKWESVNLLVAAGADQDPARFGPQPANVRIEPSLPLPLLLPNAALFITHGGFNSVKESLSAGTPMLVVPLGGDQHYSAQRCEALGVGLAVPPGSRTPEVIRERALQILGDDRYGRRSAEVRAQLQALPDVGQAAHLLERLALG